jgi:hypothetical protein
VFAVRRRLWSETVSFDRVAEPSLLAELAARRIDLLVAVTPQTIRGAPRLVDSCRAAGVGVGLWPMLDDGDGRWPSAANAAPFASFCRDLVASLRATGLPDEIAIDLEPPIDRVRAMLGGSARALLHRPAREAIGPLADLASELRGEGLRVSAVLTPLAVLPSALASRGWQDLLGTPVDGLACDSVNAMAYTSLFEGYSRGLLRRDDALAVLRAIAASCARRWGSRAAISLGVVGVGALGDERAYRSPRELAEDAALAREAGIADVVLFGLDGVLARPPREAWLDALDAPYPAPPVTATPRSRAALAAGSAIGLVAAGLGYLPRRRDQARGW